MKLNKKLQREFSKFDEEQKRLLICAISSYTVGVFYLEKEAHFKQNLEGLDEDSLEWLTQFLTSYISENNGS